MATRLDQYSSAPSTYRDLLAQRGQAELDALNQQFPGVADLKPMLQAPSASAQMTPQSGGDAIGNYLSTQSLAPTGSATAMIGPEPKNAMAALSDQGDQSFNQFCQKFVEQATLGHSGVYPSAIAAWNAQQDKAKPGFDGIQPGDLVYFGADQSNQNAGHTGIYTGNGNFVSATDNGVKQVPLSNWLQSTGQRYLGYIPASAVGDPASKGAPGKGGGNPLSDLANYAKNGLAHVWEGMQNKPLGTDPAVENTGGYMLGSFLGGFTPEGAGSDIAKNALGTALHASGATAHIGSMLPMVAGALRDAAPAEDAAVQVSNVPGIKYLPIDSLISHEGAPDANRVAQNVALARQGGEIPPLLSTKEGDGYGIMDGSHRLEAFRQLGQKFVPTINMSSPNPDTLNAYNQVLDQANNRMKGLPPSPGSFTIPYWGNR
jgi:hypothetical protein